MAALLAGQGVDSVAEEFNLPPGTVKTWKREAKQKLRHSVKSKSDQPQKEDEPGSSKSSSSSSDAVINDPIGDGIDLYIKESLETLAVQQRHFRDPKWLERQSASELAVLHGVTADKTIRILQAIEDAHRED